MTRYNFELESFIRLRGKALKRYRITCLRPHPYCAGEIWKRSFNKSIIGFDEVLTLETSAFESLYGGHFTLSNQSIKPNYLVNKYSPSTQYHSFFRKLPLCSLVLWLGLSSNPFRKRSSDPRNLRTELVGNDDLTIIIRCDRWLSRFEIPPKLCGRKRFCLRVKPLFSLV